MLAHIEASPRRILKRNEEEVEEGEEEKKEIEDNSADSDFLNKNKLEFSLSKTVCQKLASITDLLQ